MLRLLGVIYAVAFLVAVNQVLPLMGTNGLTPMNVYLQNVGNALGGTGEGFIRLPSLFWYWHSDTVLLSIAWIGCMLSLVVVAGYANAPLLAIIWFLYMSFVHAGQEWYSYGLEIQLTETGFLAIFLCPLVDYAALSPNGATSSHYCFIPLANFQDYVWSRHDQGAWRSELAG